MGLGHRTACATALLFAWLPVAVVGARAADGAVPLVDPEEEVCNLRDGGACAGDGGQEVPLNRTIEDDPHYEDGIARDILKICPVTTTPVRHVLQVLLRSMSYGTPLYRLLGLWPKGVYTDGWADDYTISNYLFVVRIALGLYKARDRTWVNVPTTQMGPDDVVRVENVYAPHSDVDGSPNFFWFEGMLPESVLKAAYVPMVTCFYSALRRLSTDTGELNATFFDDLDDPLKNTWEVAMKGSDHKTKYEWVMSFYNNAKTWDNGPLWPRQETNFQTYFKRDMWDDELEHAIAFHLIGSHRVESGSWTFTGMPGIESVTSPYRLPLNMLAGLEIRKGFGKYGADMYFNADGMPTLIKTPDGEIVTRGDTSWQYWKFVWRSTLVTAVTLLDHLHMTHFRTANLLARAVRTALPPVSPLRRITSIFTFGSIFVNMQAMHTLIGPNHLLHRATPLADFAKISNIVPTTEALLSDVTDNPAIRALLYEDAWSELDSRLKQMPFYADGKLIMDAVKRVTAGFMDHTWPFACLQDGTFHEDYVSMRKQIAAETTEANYAVNASDYEMLLNDKNCQDSNAKEVMTHRLVAYFFIVSGWHRQVGFVGDYYGDPTLATMSWKDGEAFGRPRQHMIMTFINVFTASSQPFLNEDYTHMFKGMVPNLEAEFTAVWRAFQKDLQQIEREIDNRNKKRKIVNINMSPKVLECAVSK